jgi:hypothetical protein
MAGLMRTSSSATVRREPRELTRLRHRHSHLGKKRKFQIGIRAEQRSKRRVTLLRHVFYSPHLTVPDNIVKQIAEGRPVVLALLCSGLQTYYRPTTEEPLEMTGKPAVTGAKIEAWIAGAVDVSEDLPRLFE